MAKGWLQNIRKKYKIEFANKIENKKNKIK